MGRRHKVFISYHHALDQAYKNEFIRLFGNRIVDYSVWDGDIESTAPNEAIRQTIRDHYIADATVVVVLVGAQTWQRKHVDWEIAAGLRDTARNPRTGLLGILLPTYPRPASFTAMRWADPATVHFQGRSAAPGMRPYDHFTVPKKLARNIEETGFATLRPWTNDPEWMEAWIHEAFLRRDRNPPPVIGDMYAKNQSGDRWYP